MVIGQFSDTFLPVVDGVGRVAVNYAKTLTALGHECYVVTALEDTGYRGNLPFDIIDYVGVPVPGSPQYRAGIAVLDTHYLRRVNKAPFDIIHAHSPFIAGQEALRIAYKRDIPLVGTFHSKYYDDFYKATGVELLAELGTHYVVDFFENCDEVWAVSESSADVLTDYGYKGDIKIMENGTELREPRREDLEAACARFGLSKEEPVLLFVGQLNWKKNIMNVLKAAALLRERTAAFKLVLVGQGPDREAIEAAATELKIDDITVFTGHVTDTAILDGLYQRASLFVFPSVYDNAPMVLREAAAMGTPAVLTRGSCAAEIIQDGVNGLLSQDSPEDLARVLEANITDRAKLRALGSSARSSVPVPWEPIIETAVTRYKSLIERGPNTENHARRERLLARLAEHANDGRAH